MEKKRVALRRVDGGDERWRWWEGMSPEVLALIFTLIPADQLLRTVPFVCKSWREVVAGPYCWAEIDLEQWCRRVNRSDVIDFAVRKLVRRSKGNLRRLSSYRLGDSGFSFVANSGRFLKVLQFPMSEVTDKMVEKHAESLAKLTVLDISYCLNITSEGIETFGKNCKSLVHLRRNMPPPEYQLTSEDGVAARAEESEAMAIANTMTGLGHLELAYGRFSDIGLDAILSKCKALHLLDIRGCWNVRLEGNIEQKCDCIEAFRDPWEDEYDDDDCSGSDGDKNNAAAVLVDVDTSDESD